jgi:hypothetical protein
MAPGHHQTAGLLNKAVKGEYGEKPGDAEMCRQWKTVIRKQAEHREESIPESHWNRRSCMKITTFSPLIVRQNAEPVIALFEELGNERRHT